MGLTDPMMLELPESIASDHDDHPCRRLMGKRGNRNNRGKGWLDFCTLGASWAIRSWQQSAHEKKRIEAAAKLKVDNARWDRQIAQEKAEKEAAIAASHREEALKKREEPLKRHA